MNILDHPPGSANSAPSSEQRCQQLLVHTLAIWPPHPDASGKQLQAPEIAILVTELHEAVMREKDSLSKFLVSHVLSLSPIAS